MSYDYVHIYNVYAYRREREREIETERPSSLLLHVGPTDVHNVKSLYEYRVQS